MPHEVLPRSLDAVRALSPRRRLIAVGVAVVALLGAGYWLLGGSSPPPPPRPLLSEVKSVLPELSRIA